MSIITYNGLVDLVKQGVIESCDLANVNAASVDLTLGRWIWLEEATGATVDLASKGTPHLFKHDLIEDGPYALGPGEFALAQTQQVFHLPNDVAFEFKLKSSLARSGLDHFLAGYADPGWHGSVLTLEYKNCLQFHRLTLSYGMKCGQAVFYRGAPVPKHASYAERGQYNNQTTAQPSLGVR